MGTAGAATVPRAGFDASPRRRGLSGTQPGPRVAYTRGGALPPQTARERSLCWPGPCQCASCPPAHPDLLVVSVCLVSFEDTLTRVVSTQEGWCGLECSPPRHAMSHGMSQRQVPAGSLLPACLPACHTVLPPLPQPCHYEELQNQICASHTVSHTAATGLSLAFGFAGRVSWPPGVPCQQYLPCGHSWQTLVAVQTGAGSQQGGTAMSTAVEGLAASLGRRPRAANPAHPHAAAAGDHAPGRALSVMLAGE